MKTKRNHIVCKDFACFKNGNIIRCLNCKKGKVIVICFNCGKKHVIKSQIIRIDCECGGGFIPCYDLSEFVNKKLNSQTKPIMNKGGKNNG